MIEFWLTDLPDERLTKPQTAALLGASIDTLDRWATRGQGRPRLRFSSRMSRYQASVRCAALPEQRTAFAAGSANCPAFEQFDRFLSKKIQSTNCDLTHTYGA